MISTRAILNTLKTKKGFVTDKELAEDMGVTYGALTNWISRDSLQYEPVIDYAMKNNIDLNELFSGKKDNIDITSTDMDAHIIKLVRDKFFFYADNGGRLLTAPFAASIKEVLDDYDKKVEKLIAALKD